jgi:hypothetical protein
MSLYGSFDRAQHFNELNTPLPASGGSKAFTPAQRKAACLANLGAQGIAQTIATVAALGSTQGNAAPIALGYTLVTGADGTKGVVLPAGTPGAQVQIKNNAAAILKVWPAGTNAINALGASNSISFASLASADLTTVDGITWFTNPTVPS